MDALVNVQKKIWLSFKYKYKKKIKKGGGTWDLKFSAIYSKAEIPLPMYLQIFPTILEFNEKSWKKFTFQTINCIYFSY